MQSEIDLRPLFAPKRIAVLGASSSPEKIGNQVLANLLGGGYQGDIHPVNPKGGEILGIPVVTSVADLPQGLDLAVICLPRTFVVPSLKDLAGIGTKAVIVISAGFKEVGGKGYYLEEEIKSIAAEHSIALLGPNCLGLIDTGSRVNASFAAGQPYKGSIGFFSQSGALCVAILDWALGESIGFSKFVSLGNKAVLNESSMLRYLGQDTETKVILGYIEGVEHGQEFVRVSQEVTRNKPVIMIKSGTTAAGAKAASSHTGAMAGSEQAYQAAIRQSGIIRVNDLNMLFHLADAFSAQPLPKGSNLAIVTNSGGPGILAADACEKSKLFMASLTASTIEELKKFLPTYASFYNPVDIIGDANAERYKKTLEVVVRDPHVSVVLVLLTPTGSVEIEETARAIIEVAGTTEKPMFACFMGKKRVAVGQELLRDAGIPCYSFPEPAIRSIEAMALYHQWKTRPFPVQVCYRRDKPKAEKIIQQAKAQGRSEIVEFQAQGLLKAYELPVPETTLARTSQEAVKAAKRLGFPVVLKIASPQISHKSDVGGVKVGLATPEEVQHAFLDITSRAQRLQKDAFISGCLVQQMAPKGSKEIIVGFKRDPQFGPLIMFGLGGIYVEILKDISFRLAPLSLSDAYEMIREIRSFHLLQGVRGEDPVDLKAIEDIILTMAQLALDFPEIYEAEFNPVLVGPKGALVADVRLTLT
ncbi:MAG: acetate--CoA ligase family protein [Desulfovibrionales bacterium]